MQFLTSVAEKPYYKGIFGAEGVLQSLCEKVCHTLSLFSFVFRKLKIKMENTGGCAKHEVS